MQVSRLSQIIKLGLAFLISLTLIATNAQACTRVLINDNQPSVMVGRTMDWMEDMQTELVVLPRGIPKTGMMPVPEDKNPLEWISKYGSIVATAYHIAATDGMNEKGLAAHGLWLDESDYGTRNQKIPGMSVAMWVQYYLDNFASVKEAVQASQSNSFQLVPFYHEGTGQWVQVHMALEDASGDSAVIEFINGEAKIYHGNIYKVLTNSPTLDKQLENAKQYRGLGGDKRLPGTTHANDRFVRASFYANKMFGAGSLREELSSVMSILDNVAEPQGISKPEDHDYSPTIWRIVSDLTQQTYYFKSSNSLHTIWVKLSDFNLEQGSPIMKLDVSGQSDLSGDVTKKFVRA